MNASARRHILAFDYFRARRWIQAGFCDDRRLQCHHVRRRRHLVFFGLGARARLRRLNGAWYSHLDRDGGDDDQDDDSALVPLQAAGEVADLKHL